MIRTGIAILLVAAGLFGLRLLAWQLTRLTSRALERLTDALDRTRHHHRVAGLGTALAQRFPRTARVIAARTTRQQFTGLPLTLMTLAALYVLVLIGGLVEELLEAEEMVRFDHWVNQGLSALRSGNLLGVFSWLTGLGDSVTVVAVALATTGLVWAYRHTHAIVPLWTVVIGSQITTYTSKYILARERPEAVTEIIAITPSFPSGHSTSAMAVYGFLVYLIARNLPAVRQRFEVVFWSATIIALIGFSRMILGLHYASDVAAGFLIGVLWLLIGFALIEYRARSD